jgi:hypothetical protein
VALGWVVFFSLFKQEVLRLLCLKKKKKDKRKEKKKTVTSQLNSQL